MGDPQNLPKVTEKVLFLTRVTSRHHRTVPKLTVSEQDETDEEPYNLVGYGQPPVIPDDDDEKLGPDEVPFEMLQ